MNAGAGESPAISAKRRVDEGLEALRTGLAPYVEKHMRDRHGAEWWQYASGARDVEATGPLDVQALLKTLNRNWNDLFQHDSRLRKTRSFVYLALDARNAAAHFPGEMEARAALRHLDAMWELLAAVGASRQESALAALYDEQLKACGGPPPPPPPGDTVCPSGTDISAPRGKYAPLYRHLSARHDARWLASLGEIEAILGFRLPASARRYRAWWANGGHSQADAWLAAGWRIRSVDFGKETLVFERMVPAQPDPGAAIPRLVGEWRS